MSVKQKRQSTHDEPKQEEPKQDVQSERELTNEELDRLAGGIADSTSPEPPPIAPDESSTPAGSWSIKQAWPQKYD